MNNTQITFAGNLTADPELRYSKQGRPVANFTVASTPRIYDYKTNEWQDGDTVFNRCVVWGPEAENIAASLAKGNRVVVVGKLNQSNWETKDGEKRTGFEVNVDEIGASLKFHTIEGITKAEYDATDHDEDEEVVEEPKPAKRAVKSASRSRR